jgi:cell division protein FtsI (penicillin-binding protein 3)
VSGPTKSAAARSNAAKARAAASVRSFNYSTSPLLAAPTPPWRSKLLVALVGLGFALLLGRAVYVQILDAPFFLKQGEIRYGHTIEMPASRGRIVDRNGLILAASVPAPSIWAIPKDLEGNAASRARLATLLGMTSAALENRLAENQNFVWLRRQVDDPVAKAVRGLGIKGIHEVREYKRKYPEVEAAAHVVGFTHVEERCQEGIELAF